MGREKRELELSSTFLHEAFGNLLSMIFVGQGFERRFTILTCREHVRAYAFAIRQSARHVSEGVYGVIDDWYFHWTAIVIRNEAKKCFFERMLSLTVLINLKCAKSF